ncbi:alpha/beta fold hydrolase [Prauserella sp. ASG 168]|uniref:Alpha/beta fold hydrolase n=1 Tax=Prauserella cavernicola TaxID=2800127 RepID=A0A934QRL9_9PSEU|nr:alpha/beta fold hydrolase [Prauserella cavernicola]
MAAIGFSGSMFAAPAVADEPATRVKWGPCPEDVVAGAAPTQLECGTVTVPLDYSTPDGEQIELTISRLASTKPDKRRGVLMLNPGGPGGSGLTQPAFLVSRGLPNSVMDSYDVIGMDTRGVGHSTKMGCGFTVDTEYGGNLPVYAPDDAAVTEQARIAKDVAEQCAKNDDRLKHLSTENTARDLDRIRAALGEEKTSYLGYSYGTALGATYASLFPERTDRVVLDSNLGDTHLGRDGLRRYALGMEDTFPDFAMWAAARHETYGLGSTPEQVRETYFELAERLDEHPMPGIDGAQFRSATLGLLYQRMQYGELAQTWQYVLDAEEGAAPPEPDAAADAAPSPSDNAWSVLLAVTCNDVEWAEDVDTYRSAVAEDREKYPMYGAAAANIQPCAFWAHERTEPPVAINDEGPANILIMQNKRDPVTPHRNGELMREKFEDRSRLVSADESGHGTYLLSDNSCALNIGTSYLVDGELPKDQVCQAD